MNIIKLTSIILLFFTVACSHYAKDVERALRLAGDNRPELEQVLKHYIKKPEDSLKYRAAEFLIANMPGKGSVYTRYYDRHGREMQLEGMKAATEEAAAQKDSLSRLSRRTETITEPDVEHITAEYLIENIDRAFEAWQYPWAAHVPFDDFCRYVLPYRCFTEPLSLHWRGKAMKMYNWLADSMQNKHDPIEACILINRDMRRWFDGGIQLVDYRPSFDSVLTHRYGTCEEMAYLAAYLMRAMGLAISIDMIPHWPMQGLGHAWCNVRDSTGQHVMFNPVYDDPLTKFGTYNRYSKIYRKEFMINWDSPTLTHPDWEITPLFRQIDLFDVTGNYTTTCDIPITWKSKPQGVPTVTYLAVLNGRDWKPTAWSEVHNGTAWFNSIGNNGILYRHILCDRQGTTILESPPFVLEGTCIVNFLIPDSLSQESFQLRRYARKDIGNNLSFDLYCYEKGWKYLQTAESKDSALVMTNFPSNALLILQLTGQPFNPDSRPFIIVDGMPVFK